MNQPKKPVSAVLLALLLVLVGPSSYVQSRTVTYGPATFQPGTNETMVDANISSIQVPANHTITSGFMTVEPVWETVEGNGSYYGGTHDHSWANGTYNDTFSLGFGGQLSLASDSSVGSLTDFESTKMVPTGWLTMGQDGEAWGVENLSSLQSGPSVRDGNHSLAYLITDLNASGCISSPQYDTPEFVRNMSFTFDHWRSMASDDAAWVEYTLDDQSSWQQLNPMGGYSDSVTSNHHTVVQSMTSIWAGDDQAWTTARFELDLLPNIANSETMRFRLCIAVGSSNSLRDGWFIDNVTWYNQGDEPGAWFHGNLTGDYAPNADGTLLLPMNLSGLTNPIELEFQANWDIEGGYNDGMLISYSLDNGTTWIRLSQPPGLPGNGVVYQGVTYIDESFGWIPQSYTIPTTASSHTNASNALLKFNVGTDAIVNHGGGAPANGWEGIMIDDVQLHSRAGTANHVVRILNNFTHQPTYQNGSAEGWLNNVSAPNEWQWISTMGANGPTIVGDSFENPHMMPEGWSIENIRGVGWSHGLLASSSVGPQQWHSGQYGLGIQLNGQYAANSYAHLISPEYILPTNVTAQLSFRHWICTESAWDGGAVSLSTDGGLSWWYLPADPGGFHDQISTVNTASPFYGEGILDGSRVTGNCGNRPAHAFELKTSDISNLSGQSVRLRFSFFSDQYIERDGWYIDDAGIDVALFEAEGDWTSPPITPHHVFGYGHVDGLAHEPDNTTLRFSLLDLNGEIIPEYEQRILPFAVNLNPVEHPSVQLLVHMNSSDPYLTPTVERLGLGMLQMFGRYHQNYNSEMSSLETTQEGYILATTATSIPFSHRPGCVYDSVTTHQVGGNVTLTSTAFNQGQTSFSLEPSPLRLQQFNGVNERTISSDWTFSLNSGDQFKSLMIELQCLTAPMNPSVLIGQNQLEAISWPPTGMDLNYGLQRMFDSAVSGSSVLDASQHGQLHINTSSMTTYQIRHHIALPISAISMSSVCSLVESSFIVRATSGVAQTELYLNDHLHSTIPSQSTKRIAIENECPSFDIISIATSNEWVWGYAQYNVSSSYPVELVVYDLLVVPSHGELKFSFHESLLNQALNASYNGNDRELLDLPFRVQTQQGGVNVELEIESQPNLIDSVIDAPPSRWLPNTLRSITTHHLRTIPTHPTLEAPALDRIFLSIGSTDDESSIRIRAEVDRLDATPRFFQTDGAGYAALQPSSVANCSKSECTITWIFESTWLNDDIDDLHWFVSSVDENGLETGPLVYSQNTAYNDIENDLEAFNVIAYDNRGRALHDWTQPIWPLHVNPGTSFNVQGQVRYQGIAEAWVGENDAEVTIEVHAVPPINESGPNEWIDEPIIWTLSNSSNVSADGRFAIPLTIPDDDSLPTNTRLEARIILSRCGPNGIGLQSSFDQTAESTFFEMIYDKTHPDMIRLEVLDPSGFQPAENHVWHPDNDIPLRLLVRDGEGLETPLTIYTWSEHQDDTNGNGLMEESEYQSMTANINRGVLEAEVDLPLLDASAVLRPGDAQGRLSIVVAGFDLAGNPLQSGGSFGEENDSATILVQPRQATLLDTDTIFLDSIDGNLFPGQQHHFQFDIIDGNGIDSLDSINIGLMNSLHEDCWVEYEPRFNQTTADVSCFVATPTVTVTKDNLTMRWTVDIGFQFRWDAMHEWSGKAFTPSIKVIDEAQDLGLGATYLTSSNWSTHTRLEIMIESINDRVAPFGILDDGVLTLHPDDFADVHLVIVHDQTHQPALNLPSDTRVHYNISSFAVQHDASEIGVDHQGLSQYRLVVNQTTLPAGEGELTFELSGSVFSFEQPILVELLLDDQSPTVTVEPGSLSNLDSQHINDISVRVFIQDDIAVPTSGAELHWCFVRRGIVVDQSISSIPMMHNGTTGNVATFSAILDVESHGVQFEKDDRLSVWFSHTDRAGNLLSGQGTATVPLDVQVVWMAYEPTPTSVEANPYRPVLGEMVTIEFTIENTGFLSGSTDLYLLDSEGVILDNSTIELDPDEKERIVWTIQAWDTGRLGLMIQLDDNPLLIPVPLGEVMAEDFDAKSSKSELGLNVLLVLLAAGAVIASILMRKQRIRALYDEFEYEEDEVIAPPRPAGLDDADQEE